MSTAMKSTSRRTFLLGAALGAAALGARKSAAAGKRPNIIWIIAEDMSRHFGYNGETLVKTPNVDRLAAEGARFEEAYITCPVCSPARSALVTGMYQTTIGAHNHRSSRGAVKYNLPAHVKLIPQYFREAGYYVCNCQSGDFSKPGKTDYNFVYGNGVYDEGDWTKRAADQPFFAQIQLKGGKNRGAKVPEPVDPVKVKLPPYYPDDPLLREDWARYLNSVMYVDIVVGKVMDALKEQGIADNTIIFFLTDHGISHARGKQFLYQEGIHIPLVAWGPGHIPAGSVRNDLTASIDLAATSMYFAGIPIPDYLESRPLYGPEAKPRDYVVCARDRCDETVERLRSIRKGHWKYIRNYYPKRPHLQPCAYKDAKPILIALRRLHAEGKLSPIQDRILFSPTRPEEELYDLNKDPWELENLANTRAHRSTLKELRADLETWIAETGDQGQYPEHPVMYDSDMKVYVDGMKRRKDKAEHAKVIEANIRQMKAWRDQGI